MIVSLIAAVAENGVIGSGNRLPWRLPADLRRFKELTLGHTVIMGRKTLESIGRPLPSRRNIVVTGRPSLGISGVEIARSIEEALKLCDGEREVFVIGGARIYAEAFRYVSRIHLTRIHRSIPGDTHFPEWDQREFRLVSRVDHSESGENPLPFSYLQYERFPEHGAESERSPAGKP